MAQSAQVLPRTFGRYTLLEHLGEGGMAEVLLARQEGIEETHRLVAIKRVLPALARDREFVDMFLDELRIVFTLKHPNIGHIFEVGEAEGTHFLAMEYIPGRDLGQICRLLETNSERAPLDLAVQVGCEVCDALHHAHTKADNGGRPLNIVHRDITPDNIIITFDGKVKLVDFGIAMAENRLFKTRAGVLKGKPPYMAPEIVLDLGIDGRADLFSLGVVLYRLVTGVHPFAAPTPDQVFNRIIEEQPVEPLKLNEDCPPSLSAAIMRAIEKQADSRFADATDFSEALEKIAVEFGRLPTPRSVARWLAELFPNAAAASNRALADPTDGRAAADASYLSVSRSQILDATMEESEVVSRLLTRFVPASRRSSDAPLSRLMTAPAILTRAPELETDGSRDHESAGRLFNEEGDDFDAEKDAAPERVSGSSAWEEKTPRLGTEAQEDIGGQCDTSADGISRIATVIVQHENLRPPVPADSEPEHHELAAAEPTGCHGLPTADPTDYHELSSAGPTDSHEPSPGEPTVIHDIRTATRGRVRASLEQDVFKGKTSALERERDEDGPTLETWSPWQHWEHLPQEIKGPGVLGLAASFLVILLFLALLGIRSCL